MKELIKMVENEYRQLREVMPSNPLLKYFRTDERGLNFCVEHETLTEFRERFGPSRSELFEKKSFAEYARHLTTVTLANYKRALEAAIELQNMGVTLQ